jgi:two-component system, chemotaxis family, response regulator WspR
VAYALAFFGLLLVGAGYLLGLRQGRIREEALKASLDDRDQKLTQLEGELVRHTAVDPETGLHTQQYFQEFLEREWRRASRERQPVAVIMVELDHFRAFHERQGQSEADASLKRIAAALKPLVHRPSDAISRYGGAGKFGVVLGGTDAKGAMVLAERLRTAVEAMKEPNPASPAGVTMATLGVACMTPDRDGAWQEIALIASAERALSQARDAGRNTVVLDTASAPIRS